MGTISGYYSRQDVVNDLVKQYSGERFSIIDRKATNFGRHLWMVIQPKEGPSFVCLFKLSSYGGDWGYKAIDESMGPVYWDCPVSLIQQADPPTTEYATNWRNEVYRSNGRLYNNNKTYTCAGCEPDEKHPDVDYCDDCGGK
tara:strand:- start:408 stop:833 length:426 start_codon:yes stop_codon:yes gene_type:complete